MFATTEENGRSESVNELPFSIQDKIDKYEPITTDGITTYPIQVKNLRQFAICRPVLDFVHQSLPVTLLIVPLLDAFFKLDLKELQETGTVKGYISASILLLCLALRLGEGLEAQDRAKLCRIIPDKDDPQRLAEFRFYPPEEGAKPVIVTPRQFTALRKIIAAQNGAEIVSETANPEIIEAERLLARNHAGDLEPTLYDKVIFAAQGSHVTEDTVLEWPILKMERHAAVYKRTIDYSALLTAEASGMVEFKNGNPVPSPIFARKKNGLSSMQEIGAIGNGKAKEAAAKAAKQ